MRIPLNDRRIAALRVPTLAQRQCDYWDSSMRGSGVRVSYGGKKVFVVRYRPASRIKGPWLEQSRDRVLGDDEIRELWHVLEQLALPVTPDAVEAGSDSDAQPIRRVITPATAQAFQVQFLTAQRPGEARDMKWAHIDLETGWWTLPASATKNGKAHRVPLPEWAVAILRERKATAKESAVHVFENRTGSILHRGKKAASLLCQVLSFEFRAHDLRRTAATRMAEAGIAREHLAKVLNHTEGGAAATRVYDRYTYDAEKRQALDAWARSLNAFLENDRGRKKVLAFSASGSS